MNSAQEKAWSVRSHHQVDVRRAATLELPDRLERACGPGLTISNVRAFKHDQVGDEYMVVLSGVASFRGHREPFTWTIRLHIVVRGGQKLWFVHSDTVCTKLVKAVKAIRENSAHHETFRRASRPAHSWL